MSGGWEQTETYPCHIMCTEDGAYDEGSRRVHRCALVHRAIPLVLESDWGENPQPRRVHMGRLPIVDQDEIFAVANPKAPEESHEDGCPGAWYRSGFADSIRRYERLFNPQSGFSSNINLDRTDDQLVIDATQYLENEILRCHSADSEIRWSDR